MLSSDKNFRFIAVEAYILLGLRRLPPELINKTCAIGHQISLCTEGQIRYPSPERLSVPHHNVGYLARRVVCPYVLSLIVSHDIS